MWVSRLHYESMFENLTRERERSIVLRVRIQQLETTQEWLREHVNRLEQDRRILTETRLGLLLPQPTIERVEPADTQTTAPGIDPGSVHGTPDDSIPLAQMMSAALEDMGDDAAGRMGIAHDPQGMLVYKQ